MKHIWKLGLIFIILLFIICMIIYGIIYDVTPTDILIRQAEPIESSAELIIIETDESLDSAIEYIEDTESMTIGEEQIIEIDQIAEEADTDPHFDNEYDNMIYQATKGTAIDPYVAIAISRLETGHYKSNAFINGYNFGGMTGSNGVMSFDSLQHGLDRYVSMLEWYYKNGMDTPEKMQSTYCPPNDEWDDIVNCIYNEFISDI